MHGPIVLLRLGVTLTGKKICRALGGSVVERDSAAADVHFFRNQNNRFKTRMALALYFCSFA